MSESTNTPGQTESGTGETSTGEPPEKMGSVPPEGESATAKDEYTEGERTGPA